MKKIDTLIRGVLLCALALIFSPTILFAQVEQTQPCGSDQTSQYKKARTAVHAAAVTVFGQKFDECAIEGWVSSIKFNNAYESFRQKYNAADFQFSDALAFLKLQLADAQKSKLRQTAVKNAIMEVRGRDYLTEEFFRHDQPMKQQKAWYATIVAAEIEQMNQQPIERTSMIHTVYQTAMGRNADETSLKYWQPRKEHYRPLLEANRSWLYSPNGLKDLRETVARALEAKTKKKPNAAEINAAIQKFKPQKLIYTEMVNGKPQITPID